MKITANIYLAMALAAVVSACNSSTESEKDTSTEAVQAEAQSKEVCTYSYDPQSTEVLWVAYKFTNKTGVNGTFKTVNVSGVSSADSPAAMLQGAKFEIMTESIDSGDPTRDPKIKEFFFGNLEGSDKITGAITAVEGGEKEGSIKAKLMLNGVEKEVGGSYTYDDAKLEARFELNMEDFGAMKGIAELNKACEDLHKGPDGSSKLWPDVTVFVSTTPVKNCK
ncbi:MAG: YceI family protein [Salibacteraceae bacterium]